MFLGADQKGEGFGGPFERRLVPARNLSIGDRFIDGFEVWQVGGSGRDSHGNFFIVFRKRKGFTPIDRNRKFYYIEDTRVALDPQ